MMLVERKEYLKKLISWKDEKVIKVITGLRRAGKSTLLKQYQQKLREMNVSEDQIIYINFENLNNEELLNYNTLHSYLESKLVKDKMTYIFLDEIQRVENFQKCVDSIYIKENTDIYITGSNAYLLSGELATLLSGRYVEILILPLSFREYIELNHETNQPDKAFASYMKYGGLPYISTMEKTDDKITLYLDGNYNTVVVKDIIDREVRKGTRRVTDISLLNTIARYLSSVIGSPVSIKAVTDYITSNGRKVSLNTIDDYISALTESYLFYPCQRYDISGKELLKNNNKFYTVDLGLRNYILPKKNYDLGFSIENLVFLELQRRGWKVNTGKLHNAEVDFVATKNGDINYFQVTTDMTQESTFEREMKSLRAIKDNYNKIVLTLDRFTEGIYNGIKVINLIDWLLGQA
jgi:uncharacterized protein